MGEFFEENKRFCFFFLDICSDLNTVVIFRILLNLKTQEVSRKPKFYCIGEQEIGLEKVMKNLNFMKKFILPYKHNSVFTRM